MINKANSKLKTIAKIISTCDKTNYGTGFLVNTNIILTAKHVIIDNINNINNIEVIFDQINTKYSVVEVIDESDEYDLVLLRLDKHINEFEYVKFGCFPSNKVDLCNPKIYYQILGYILEDWGKQASFWCFINNFNTDGVWDFNLSIVQQTHQFLKFKGLSGSPLFYGDKVFGIVLEQVSNLKGIPLGVISTYKIRKFLKKNKIVCNEYADFEMLEEEKIKISLLEAVEDEINNRLAGDTEIKIAMRLAKKRVIGVLEKLTIEEFSLFLSSINANTDSKFDVLSDYKQYIHALSEIIIQIIILFISYDGEISLLFEMDANIKINKDKYIRYLFSDRYGSYSHVAMKFFRYILDNPTLKLDKTSSILIGNDRCFDCEDRCSQTYRGAKFNLDPIINEITYPFLEAEYKQDLVNIRDKFNDISFHCKNCLNYDLINSSTEIARNVKNVFGGD